ncbi:MAG: hypothetical protein HY287_01880 [Planctomycetes bacterium]|nr:hypothetical protein [Planctomycetota bacterium]MBI3833059.1 hypothetical protein [Planctomycetota bacterium]
MPLVDTQQFTKTIGGLRDAANTALSNQSVDDFEAFERNLNQVEGYVREIQQSLWADDAKATIRKLEKNQELADADREVLRTFLISDARAYLAEENNYQDWVAEMERIIQTLEQSVANVDRDNIADLRGILKDAIRLVPDIRNYLEEQRRVEKFEQAMKTPDKTSNDLLVRVLREQLDSPKR